MVPSPGAAEVNVPRDIPVDSLAEVLPNSVSPTSVVMWRTRRSGTRDGGMLTNKVIPTCESSGEQSVDPSVA
eukprot:206518-Prorocentrum_lima.AAC.1